MLYVSFGTKIDIKENQYFHFQKTGMFLKSISFARVLEGTYAELGASSTFESEYFFFTVVELSLILKERDLSLAAQSKMSSLQPSMCAGA